MSWLLLAFCNKPFGRKRPLTVQVKLDGCLGFFGFYLVMLSHYPAIKDVVLPSNFLLESLGSSWFQVLFQVVLPGTLIETGVAVIHAFNERLASLYRTRNQTMPRKLRPITAIILMVIASLLAKIGLVKLIMIAAQTYAWFFLVM